VQDMVISDKWSVHEQLHLRRLSKIMALVTVAPQVQIAYPTLEKMSQRAAHPALG
jgi:hypothetical protein